MITLVWLQSFPLFSTKISVCSHLPWNSHGKVQVSSQVFSVYTKTAIFDYDFKTSSITFNRLKFNSICLQKTQWYKLLKCSSAFQCLSSNLCFRSSLHCSYLCQQIQLKNNSQKSQLIMLKVTLLEEIRLLPKNITKVN